MKIFAVAVLSMCFVACGGAASSGSGASQNKGIVYKPASQIVNEKAAGYLSGLMKNAQAASTRTEGQRFMCGPALWSQIRNSPKASGINGAPAMMMIPTAGGIIQMEGRLLQSNEDLSNFWGVFFSELDFSTATIRKLKENEKELYWMMIAWDIEEPVFVIEGPNQNLIVDLIIDESGAFEVFWIDDISGYVVK